MNKKITAYFRPQANINDYAVDIDGGYNFDVTEAIKRMGREKALDLRDNHEARDNLWRESAEGQADPHYGPFEVDLDFEVIKEFFA